MTPAASLAALIRHILLLIGDSPRHVPELVRACGRHEISACACGRLTTSACACGRLKKLKINKKSNNLLLLGSG